MSPPVLALHADGSLTINDSRFGRGVWERSAWVAPIIAEACAGRVGRLQLEAFAQLLEAARMKLAQIEVDSDMRIAAEAARIVAKARPVAVGEEG